MGATRAVADATTRIQTIGGQAPRTGPATAAEPLSGGEFGDAAELGAVTDRAVRVWVRRPGGPAPRARLEVAGRPPVEVDVPVSADTDWTGAADLLLPEPAPDRPFVCRVDGRRLAGRTAPAPDARTAFAFAFGSCHHPFAEGPDGGLVRNPAVALYPAMAAELRRAEARFLLLVGDQVYADEPPALSVRAALPGDPDHPPPLAAALAAYRLVTRASFAEPGFHALRETLPTLCMWDDHEIVNDWGSWLRRSPRDLRLFEAASRVYAEYQHSRNPGGTIAPPPYPYAFRWGTAGFLVLDTRGERDHRAGLLLGAAQTGFFRDYLHGPEASSLETLFVVVSVPVAHTARWFVALLERLHGLPASAARERWCSAGFVDSRDAFLEELFAWQTAAPRRQVVLLSGDVHAAGAFTIRQRHGPGVVQQFTSSALTTLSGLQEQLFTLVGARGSNLLEPALRFDRHRLVLANNYGLVRLDPLPEGGHRVAFEIRAWDARARRLRPAGRIVTEPA